MAVLPKIIITASPAVDIKAVKHHERMTLVGVITAVGITYPRYSVLLYGHHSTSRAVEVPVRDKGPLHGGVV